MKVKAYYVNRWNGDDTTHVVTIWAAGRKKAMSKLASASERYRLKLNRNEVRVFAAGTVLVEPFEVDTDALLTLLGE